MSQLGLTKGQLATVKQLLALGVDNVMPGSWLMDGSVAIAKLYGMIPDSMIAGLDAAKLTGSIDASRLSGVIPADQLAEADPLFSASPAAGITATDLTNWDAAYGWGDHAAAGYITVALPSGAVLPFAMNSAPAGWLACDGAAVSRTTYAALFAAIGTTYGTGDGLTTFNVPDLRGYFVRGYGTNSDATASGNFGEKQADAFESHVHAQYVSALTGGSAVRNDFDADAAGQIFPQGINTGSTGGTETRPANIAMLYCIKV